MKNSYGFPGPSSPLPRVCVFPFFFPSCWLSQKSSRGRKDGICMCPLPSFCRFSPLLHLSGTFFSSFLRSSMALDTGQKGKNAAREDSLPPPSFLSLPPFSAPFSLLPLPPLSVVRAIRQEFGSETSALFLSLLPPPSPFFLFFPPCSCTGERSTPRTAIPPNPSFLSSPPPRSIALPYENEANHFAEILFSLFFNSTLLPPPSRN